MQLYSKRFLVLTEVTVLLMLCSSCTIVKSTLPLWVAGGREAAVVSSRNITSQLENRRVSRQTRQVLTDSSGNKTSQL